MRYLSWHSLVCIHKTGSSKRDLIGPFMAQQAHTTAEGFCIFVPLAIRGSNLGLASG